MGFNSINNLIRIVLVGIALAALSFTALCLIVGISDGDTLTAKCPDQTIKIRLAEIDAPEKKQPFGTRSKESLSNLCFQTKAQVHGVTKDRYQRLIAHVNCDGQDASRHQLSAGMAWVYDQYAKDRSLYTVQDKAKASRAGLWSERSPVPPWQWRKINAAAKKTEHI